jgi:hypothetical protein
MNELRTCDLFADRHAGYRWISDYSEKIYRYDPTLRVWQEWTGLRWRRYYSFSAGSWPSSWSGDELYGGKGEVFIRLGKEL